MTLHNEVHRRDVFKPGYRFRSAITGQYVTRLFAFLNPHVTVKERG